MITVTFSFFCFVLLLLFSFSRFCKTVFFDSFFCFVVRCFDHLLNLKQDSKKKKQVLGFLKKNLKKMKSFNPNCIPPLAVCAWFCFLSLLLTLHNKYVLDEIFRSSNGVLVCQCLFSMISLLIARQLNYVAHFHASPLTATKMEMWCAASQAVNVITGLGALAFVNVVTHGVLKRGAILFSWIIEIIFERKDTTLKVLPAVLILLTGSVIAGLGDLKFSFVGYLLACISCAAQAGMFELGRRLVVGNNNNHNNDQTEPSAPKSSSHEQKESSSSSSSSSYSAVLYLNSFATLIVSAFLFVVTSAAAAQDTHSDSAVNHHQQQHFLFNNRLMPQGQSAVWIHLSINGLLSLLMNHAIFWNCAVNSSLAHTVSGNVKAALQTLFGAMMFETPLSLLGWFGVAGNIAGASLFSYIRVKYSTKKSASQAVNTAASFHSHSVSDVDQNNNGGSIKV